jgi:hypothetical protein
MRVTVEKLLAVLDQLIEDEVDETISYHAGNLRGAIERRSEDYHPTDCIVVFE